MRVLNFGSLNIDYTYSLDHIVAPGETITSQHLEVFPGGKGLNQSVALARAGVPVCHAGQVGEDGGMLLQVCQESGVDNSRIRTVETRTGNAIIQVSAKGQNSIVLYPGANREQTQEYIDQVLEEFGPGDLVLLQNEINLVDYIIQRASQRGMTIALNPSPFDERMLACDLGLVDLFLLNEVEGAQITGHQNPEEILEEMKTRFPKAQVVLTLGKAGVCYQRGEIRLRHGIYQVPVVDTTAAGDTFTGFFLGSLLRGQPVEEALRLASVASSLAVSRKGASSSIPTWEEVQRADLTCQS